MVDPPTGDCADESPSSWRNEHQQLVQQPLLVHRTEKLRPGLNHRRGDLTLASEPTQQVRDDEPPLGVRLERDHVHAPLEQRAIPIGVSLQHRRRDRDRQRRPAGHAAHQLTVQRQTPLRVYDDPACQTPQRDIAGGQERVVGQHRADPGQDRIHLRAKPVHRPA